MRQDVIAVHWKKQNKRSSTNKIVELETMCLQKFPGKLFWPSVSSTSFLASHMLVFFFGSFFFYKSSLNYHNTIILLYNNHYCLNINLFICNFYIKWLILKILWTNIGSQNKTEACVASVLNMFKFWCPLSLYSWQSTMLKVCAGE
jgi:hypothetical protein